MDALALAAPAKVNLGLRIVGRRADGYHLLDSVFAPLDLADEVALQIGPGAGVSLELEGGEGELPAGAANLAWRAARAFLDATGLAGSVRVGLRKHIPAGSGLGGGSSDAGAVLRGLGRLRPGRLDAQAARRVALELGADVPFFLDPRPARVRGVGERVEPLAGLPAFPLLLVHPGAPLPTPAVYAAYDAEPKRGTSLTPGGAVPTLAGFPALRSASASGPAPLPELLPELLGWLRDGLLANDLESAAARLCPVLVTLRRRLEEVGAAAVGLSGSGPTLFGVFASREEAAAAAARLELAAPAWSRVVRTRSSAEETDPRFGWGVAKR